MVARQVARFGIDSVVAVRRRLGALVDVSLVAVFVIAPLARLDYPLLFGDVVLEGWLGRVHQIDLHIVHVLGQVV